MKPVALHPAAEKELAEVAGFYQARSPRLALEFTDAVTEALGFVRENTEAGTPVRGALRGWLLRRFRIE